LGPEIIFYGKEGIKVRQNPKYKLGGEPRIKKPKTQIPKVFWVGIILKGGGPLFPSKFPKKKSSLLNQKKGPPKKIPKSRNLKGP